MVHPCSTCAHGCIYMPMQHIHTPARLDSWWGTHGYCWPDDLYKIGPAEPEISRCIPAARQYLVCFHICLGFILKMPWGPFITKGPGVPFHYDGDSNSMFKVYTGTSPSHEHLAFTRAPRLHTGTSSFTRAPRLNYVVKPLLLWYTLPLPSLP